MPAEAGRLLALPMNLDTIETAPSPPQRGRGGRRRERGLFVVSTRGASLRALPVNIRHRNMDRDISHKASSALSVRLMLFPVPSKLTSPLDGRRRFVLPLYFWQADIAGERWVTSRAWHRLSPAAAGADLFRTLENSSAHLPADVAAAGDSRAPAQASWWSAKKWCIASLRLDSMDSSNCWRWRVDIGLKERARATLLSMCSRRGIPTLARLTGRDRA
jgi:hypothetical protein